MEMCYNDALVMPSNYVVMDNEEMEYLDSGWCIQNTWYGYDLYLTHDERKRVTSGHIIIGLANWPVGTKILAAVGGLIANYDDGYGVRIRMFGPITKATAYMTGVFSLTAEQEKGIASENKIKIF